MNRIAGILRFDDMPVTHTELDRMIESFEPHFRDEKRIWVQGVVGLACLATGQHERSLTSPPRKGLTITFDGCIHNREDLLASLGSERLGGQRNSSDEEIVLAAYEKWELDCPKHLLGDFAFAIWDAKKHRLVCVRDHFGVKPLYYYASDTSFLFASTPEALLASGNVPVAIYEERIADFLVNPLEGIDKTSSFYTNLFRLPPAHMVVVQAGGITVQRYWELYSNVQERGLSESSYLESFQDLFAEAIRCRLQDSVLPASMLSGGMDSSSIVGIARKMLTEEGHGPLHTFAVISKSPETNRESSFILSMLAQGNVREHLISEIEISQWMDPLVCALEEEAEPFDCLMNLNRAVFLHVRDHGGSALLDGIDGDTLLSGSGHLPQLWRQGAFRTLLGETLKADGLTAEYKTGRNDFINSFLSAFLPASPVWFQELRRPVRYRKAIRSAIQESIIDPEFAARAQLGERFAKLHSHSPRPASFTTIESHKISLDHPFLTVGLERYERVASAFGIEARHPFTDVRLAEFCLSLTWQLKTHRGWTKMILRRAMEPYLPPEVVWRRDKDSLMWEVNRLILKARAEYFYQITCDEQASLKPYVDLGKLMQAWQEYLTLGEEKHADWIWSGVALAMWLRRQRETALQPRCVVRDGSG